MYEMTDKQRYMLFLFICIPVRYLYAYLQYTYKYFNLLNIVIGVTFIYQFFNWNNEMGAFGGKLWWNNMRLIHGIIYIVAYKYPILLFIDPIIGFVAKSIHYTFLI